MFHYYIEPEIIPNFLSENECIHIKQEAISKLRPSTLRPSALYNNMDERVRKSETAWLDSSDPIINNLMRKCISRIDKPIGHCEKLQVVRYKTGGFYNPHHDVIPQLSNNKRQYTFMFALNDYEGGETSFPNLDIKFKLKKRDCLFFHTLDNHKVHTSLALHGGKDVKSAEKWICNLWVWINPAPERFRAQ